MYSSEASRPEFWRMTGHPWEYDRALYKKRNEIERLFRRLKGFRRIFSRFEKLDVIFLAFLCFAFIVEALRLV
jgi:transposase